MERHDAHSLKDTYSIRSYVPGELPDLEQRMWAMMRPGAPVVPIVAGVPQVRRPRSRDSFLRAKAYAAATESSPQRSRGRPRRNSYFAAELAYMHDVERRPFIAGEGTFSLHEYLATRIKRYQTADLLAAELVSYGTASRRSRHRSRTFERWLADGRRTLHEEGAWPWALVPGGRLTSSWWEDPGFERALRAWALGEDATAERLSG